MIGDFLKLPHGRDSSRPLSRLYRHAPLDNGAYGRLVRWMQANAALCASRPIRDALEMAVQACLTVDDAWGFFTHCGYTREE